MTPEQTKQYEEVRKALNKKLEGLFEIEEYGKSFLSPRIREQILDLILSDPAIAVLGKDQALPDGFNCEVSEYGHYGLERHTYHQEMTIRQTVRKE